jgi:hypothetical protein
MLIVRIQKLCFSKKQNSYWKEVKYLRCKGLFQIETDKTIFCFYNKIEITNLNDLWKAIHYLSISNNRDKKLTKILNE